MTTELVEIVWRHACSWGGTSKDVPIGQMKNVLSSIGYLIKEDDGFLYIVQTIDKNKPDNYVNIQSIPIGSVIEKTYLEASGITRLNQMKS